MGRKNTTGEREMPYIEQKDRDRIIDNGLKHIGVAGGPLVVHADKINKPGELNYAITEVMINYLNRKGVSYTNMNEVLGVLECAKLELYRRMTVPYENEKISSNGDVY